MKRFRFTLEAVRVLRQRQEQDALDLYAKALVARQQAADRLGAARERLHEGWRDLRELLNRGCDAAALVRMKDYHRTLEKRRDECILAIGVAERRVGAAFNALMLARQQTEIVETGFQRQKARHERERAYEEQKFLDDLAGRRTASALTWNPTGG